jgi:Ca2+-binding RTX toxin-like protein
MRKNLKWILFIGLAVIVLSAAYYAVAAANIMPTSSSVDEYSHPILHDEVVPFECIGIHFGGNNELILGTTGNDTLDGKNGSDCLVGGGGHDHLNGGQGNDVLIGGDGDDTLNGGSGQDVCYGGCGIDTFPGCETIIDTCP